MNEGKDIIIALVISMSLHVALLFAFSLVSYEREHEREKVFTVELVVQDFPSNIGSRQKYMRRGGRDIHIKRSNPSDDDNNGDRSASRKSEVSRHASRKRDSQSTTDVENVSARSVNDEAISKGEIASPPDFGTHNDRISIFSDEQGGDGLIAKVNGSRENIIEGEFNSINGPSFLKMVKPNYPKLARRLGKEGKVVLRLFIDEHGRLINVEIIEKAGHGFDEAAIDAVKASSFQPAKLNGLPVACKAVLPVRFRFE